MCLRRFDTYETSIQPFEDCCTIFVAKHPVTKPNINIIKKSEEKLAEKIDELVQTAIDTVEVIEVHRYYDGALLKNAMVARA